MANGTGIEIARRLVVDKLRGQTAVLERLTDSQSVRAVLAQAIDDVARARNPAGLRATESTAAATYWSAWKDIPVQFARRDKNRVPDHWRTFGARTSPLTGSSRSAANPANAILNYLYALLEAEARTAALAMGLDPGMGVLHADVKARDSLACDLMEPVRPEVDAFVLELLQTRVFPATDFHETRAGICRVLPPLTHLLAETAPRWARAVAPITEMVAHMLLAGTGWSGRRKQQELPTLLTGAKRSMGRDALRRQPKRQADNPCPKLPPACRSCGAVLPDSDRLYCDGCHRDRRRELAAHYTGAGLEALAGLRADGRDPAHGKEAALKRGARNSQHAREVARCSREHGKNFKPVEFVQDILPRLQAIPLGAISKATGLSRGYASMIRRGLYVPHPRHWESLMTVTQHSPQTTRT